MSESSCQLRMTIPGQIVNYELSIFTNKVDIRTYLDSQRLPGKYCQLQYKVEDGSLQWIQAKVGLVYFKDDIVAVINHLKQFTLSNRGETASRNIPTLLQIIKKLESIQNVEVQKSQAKETKVAQIEDPIAQRRRIFGANQVKQISKGNVECIFCTDILVPDKFHQLKCGHCFHYVCIRNYCRQIKNECPVCKYTPKYGPNRLR